MAHRLTPLLVTTSLLLMIFLGAPTPTSAVDASPASPDQLALINVTFGTENIYLFEGEEIEINFTVLYYYGTETVVITFESEREFNFEIVNASDVAFTLTPSDVYPKTMTFNLRGSHISISEMSVLMTVDEYLFNIGSVTVKVW
nr:uncharacterized protein LOC129273091 [Lytechinus pictus]